MLSLVLLAAVVTMADTPVAAAETVARGSWAHTDLREPARTFTDGTGPPVGAWLDEKGKYHSAKSYFTFDLTSLQGKRVLDAGAVTSVTWVADCAVDSATELWRTDLSERPTWYDQPAERALQAGSAPTEPCVAPYVEWDVREAVTTALASGATKLTLALRMAGGKQYDPKYGRRFADDLRLFVSTNIPPAVPNPLSVGVVRCADPFFNPVRTPTLRTGLFDQDGDTLTGRFTLRDIADLAQPRVFEQHGVPSGTTALLNLPADVLLDGHTYELTAQAVDRHDASPPTPICRFTNDFTLPNAPAVRSVEYPPSAEPGTGGTNVPGRFTFDPAGSDDVVGYRYYVGNNRNTWPNRFVTANPDGRTMVDFTPTEPGYHVLKVMAVDRAGNSSSLVQQDLYVYDNSPHIAAPETGDLDVPVEVVFTPGMPDVVEYSYQVNDGVTHTVAADLDGRATAFVVPDAPGANVILVRGRTGTGMVSGDAWAAVEVPWYEPVVASADYPDDGAAHGGVGTPGIFEFVSSLPGTTAFMYTMTAGGTQTDPVVVPADGTGRATTTITPIISGSHYLYVQARRANGALSGGTFFDFNIQH
ncbi:hypothetical protein ACQPYE_26580 [Actinosynnema sp. CA-299493]